MEGLLCYEMHKFGASDRRQLSYGSVFDKKHTAAQCKLTFFVACYYYCSAIFAVIRQVVAYIGLAYNVEGGTGFIENQD